MRRQNVLMTGCNFPLGRQAAEALAARGHWVFATMPDCFGSGVKEARQLQNFGLMKGYRLDVLELDVTEESSVERGVGSVIGRAGYLDTVVHASGIGAVGLAEAFTVAQLRAIFETNVFGVQRVNRAVLPHMRERRQGLLLHVSSVLGRFAMPNLAVFDASMFAMEALAEAYRYELSAVGVDSVILEPGTFVNDLPRTSILPEDMDRVSYYGDNADLGDRITSHDSFESSPPVSDEMREAVDALVQLVEMPAGTRPLRTVVDRESGEAVDELNAASANLSQKYLETLGQESLLHLRR
jgi:NAD(P)-dependent dehydrogenase (short-subunit alcohol dehydrogenase family)